MSSGNELNEIFESLKELPEDLRKSITSKFAKLSGLKQLTGETAIQRDGARLDARQRAYYAKMGMPLPEDGSEMITNILADNITIGEDPVIAKTTIKDESTDKRQPQAHTQPAPEPQQPATPTEPTFGQKALPWLLGAMTVMAAGGGGSAIGYWLRDPPQENRPIGGGSSFDFDARMPEWWDQTE